MIPQNKNLAACLLPRPKKNKLPYGAVIFLPFNYKLSKYNYLQQKFYYEKPKQRILVKFSALTFLPATVIAFILSIIYLCVSFMFGKSAEAKQHVDFFLCKLQLYTEYDYLIDYPRSFAEINSRGYKVVMYYSKKKFSIQSKRKKEKTLAMLNKMKDDLYFADYFFASRADDVIEYAETEKINLRKFYCVKSKEFELETGYACPDGISF
jgi:hypothetical protein